MMKLTYIVLLAINSLACATGQCENMAIADVVLPPPMSVKEMTAISRELPKLDCSATRLNVTVTLKGRLNLFKYGQSGLENGFRVCLIGELTQWRPLSEHCHEYVPDPAHEYRFGPFPFPKKDRDRFTFANVAGNLEYRWGGIQLITVSGVCRLVSDDDGDRLVFTKHK
jgi:hypothetical protein